MRLEEANTLKCNNKYKIYIKVSKIMMLMTLNKNKTIKNLIVYLKFSLKRKYQQLQALMR